VQDGDDVIASYEAGCFGFVLYRQLTEMGVATVVAAPGLIPPQAIGASEDRPP
jgi:hypothetical protein